MNKDQIIKAMGEAFNAHVSLLFGVLCNGIAEEAGGSGGEPGKDARTRFHNGFCIAQLAHDEMLAKLTAA